MELDYDFAQNASIFRYGDQINLEDVVPGAKARVEIEEGKVSRLEVLDDLNITVEGRVVHINEEKDRLTLEINGRKYSYDLAADFTVTGTDEEKMNLSAVLNCRVSATLENGLIKKIKIKGQ